MKSENILEALNDIDHDMVEDAEEKRKKSKTTLILKWGALAACLILVVGLVLEMLPPRVPDYSSISYSAEEIANMFYEETAGPTSSYKKIYTPGELSPKPLPGYEYLTVYRYCGFSDLDKALNEEELKNFLDPKLPAVAQALDIALPGYSISTDLDWIFTADIFNDPSSKYDISCLQYSLYNRLSIDADWFNNRTGEIIWDGQRLEVDQSKSDAEILESLEWIKEKLFAIFNVYFPDAKINRSYDERSENGVSGLSVYYYNKADHTLNSVLGKPLSDYISISFNNTRNNEADFVSDTLIYDASIGYTQYRQDPKDIFAPITSVKTISLKDAEQLLFKGYVFGGHSCPVCMESQEKVDFSDYDLVKLTYVSGNLSENNAQLIPFYAFYKKLGIDKNGNTVYAQTYVPAFEVSGYEEYFKSQEAEHKS